MQFILLISYNMFIKSFDRTNEGNFVNKFSCMQIRNFRSGHFFLSQWKWYSETYVKKLALSQLPICRPLSPTQKWPYLHESCAMCWRNEWKIYFPIIIFWVMVDFILKIHRSPCLLTLIIDQIFFFVRKDTQCSETSAEPNFRFWDMVDFVFNIPCLLGT